MRVEGGADAKESGERGLRSETGAALHWREWGGGHCDSPWPYSLYAPSAASLCPLTFCFVERGASHQRL
jgi:hypothetical protein